MKFYAIHDSDGWTSKQLHRNIDSASYMAKYLILNVIDEAFYHIDILEIDTEEETILLKARLDKTTFFNS